LNHKWRTSLLPYHVPVFHGCSIDEQVNGLFVRLSSWCSSHNRELNITDNGRIINTRLVSTLPYSGDQLIMHQHHHILRLCLLSQLWMVWRCHLMFQTVCEGSISRDERMWPRNESNHMAEGFYSILCCLGRQKR
jgi:hypothetical protein